MAAILETNVKEVWDTISGHPMKFKNKPRVRREWRTLSPEMQLLAFWCLFGSFQEGEGGQGLLEAEDDARLPCRA